MLSVERCRGGRRRSGAARAAGRPGPTGSSMVCAGAAQRAVVLPLVGLDRLLAAPAPARSAAACRNRDEGRRDRGPWRVRSGPATAPMDRPGVRLAPPRERRACPRFAFIEHNGLVADRACASVVWAARSICSVGAAVGQVVWRLERHTAELSIEEARSQRRPVIVRAQRRAAHLDLAALRRSRAWLANALSRNSRHQLMRTRRLYSALGPLLLRAARTVDEALAMLEELKALAPSELEIGAASPAASPPLLRDLPS